MAKTNFPDLGIFGFVKSLLRFLKNSPPRDKIVVAVLLILLITYWFSSHYIWTTLLWVFILGAIVILMFREKEHNRHTEEMARINLDRLDASVAEKRKDIAQGDG